MAFLIEPLVVGWSRFCLVLRGRAVGGRTIKGRNHWGSSHRGSGPAELEPSGIEPSEVETSEIKSSEVKQSWVGTIRAQAIVGATSIRGKVALEEGKTTD